MSTCVLGTKLFLYRVVEKVRESWGGKADTDTAEAQCVVELFSSLSELLFVSASVSLASLWDVSHSFVYS